MRLQGLLLGALVSVFATGAGLAQQQVFHIEPERSVVRFTLPDPLHTVTGTFIVQRGLISFDPAAHTISGEVVVDAASGTSGDKARDRRMTSTELQSAKFSSVTFSPHAFSGSIGTSGESKVVVTGTFTLLGRPHEISVPMLVRRDGPQMSGNGSFVVPYVRWGLKDPSVLLLRVGKEVKVDLSLAGSVTP